MSRLSRNLVREAKRSWLYLFMLLAMVFLIAPTLIVLPMSLSDARYLSFPPKSLGWQSYLNYFGSLEWQSATRISLFTATLTMLIATSPTARCSRACCFSRFSGGR